MPFWSLHLHSLHRVDLSLAVSRCRLSASLCQVSISFTQRGAEQCGYQHPAYEGNIVSGEPVHDLASARVMNGTRCDLISVPVQALL